MERDTSNRISLAGQRVLISRPKAQSAVLEQLLLEQDAEVIALPLLEVRAVALEEMSLIAEKIQQKQYDAFLFTSANAVRFWAKQVSAVGDIQTFLKDVHIYALGQQTQAQLSLLGCSAHCDAHVRSSEDFLAMLSNTFGQALSKQHFFWPRALKVRDFLAKGLRAQGAQCTECAVYETLAIKPQEPLPKDLDWIVFASPSAVDAFLHAFGVFPKVHYACIGKVSAERLEQEGISCDALAKEPSNEGLVAAIRDYLCQ